MKTPKTPLLCSLLYLAAYGLAAAELCRADAPDKPVEAITRPSADRTLSFTREGTIAELAVQEGDRVKAGQVLVRQCTEVERAAAARLKAQADQTVRIRAQKAQRSQKRVKLKRVEELYRRKVATELELEEARLEVEIAAMSVELASFEQKQDTAKYAEMQLQIKRMSLSSPIDGVVEKIFRRRGEAVDRLEKVIRVVRINPLWIDVPVPLKRAATLARGGPARVEIDREGDRPTPAKQWVDAQIVHVAAVADAASTTRLVRVEMPNPAARPAGEHVRVTFGGAKKGT